MSAASIFVVIALRLFDFICRLERSIRATPVYRQVPLRRNTEAHGRIPERNIGGHARASILLARQACYTHITDEGDHSHILRDVRDIDRIVGGLVLLLMIFILPFSMEAQ